MPQMVSHNFCTLVMVLTEISSELAVVRRQISETNELRGAINDLGVATRLALQKAKTAKTKKAAGGSKGMCPHAYPSFLYLDTYPVRQLLLMVPNF